MEGEKCSDLENLFSNYYNYYFHLNQNDCYQCEKCGKKSTHGFRRYFILQPPSVLTICLNRFEFNGRTFTKNNSRVMPVDKLSLSPYSFGRRHNAEKDISYRLSAVVEHQGSLDRGHYTSFVKRGTNWFHISDSKVRRVTFQKVESCQPYILFYSKE